MNEWIVMLGLLFGGIAAARGCSEMRAVSVEIPLATTLEPAVLDSARQEAGWILRSLCITVEWGPGGLLVRILPDPITSDSTLDAMGMAMPQFGRGAIFLSRVRASADTYAVKISLSILLGCVLAHEIGHLLLGPGHSGDGIMSANFDKRRMERAGKRHLVFTEADRSRVLLLKRQGR